MDHWKCALRVIVTLPCVRRLSACVRISLFIRRMKNIFSENAYFYLANSFSFLYVLIFNLYNVKYVYIWTRNLVNYLGSWKKKHIVLFHTKIVYKDYIELLASSVQNVKGNFFFFFSTPLLK